VINNANPSEHHFAVIILAKENIMKKFEAVL
jgi:hypothetical protein